MSTPTPRTPWRARVQALAQALAHERPDLAARLRRAVRLVARGATLEADDSPIVRLRVRAPRGAYALPVHTGCTCRDARTAAPVLGRTPACRHYLAYWLVCRARLDDAA